MAAPHRYPRRKFPNRSNLIRLIHVSLPPSLLGSKFLAEESKRQQRLSRQVGNWDAGCIVPVLKIPSRHSRFHDSIERVRVLLPAESSKILYELKIEGRIIYTRFYCCTLETVLVNGEVCITHSYSLSSCRQPLLLELFSINICRCPVRRGVARDLLTWCRSVRGMDD